MSCLAAPARIAPQYRAAACGPRNYAVPMLTHSLANRLLDRLLNRLRWHYLSGMHHIGRTLYLGAALGMLSIASAAAPPAQSSDADTATPPPAPAKCQEALVNPVSGFAECVNPRG